MAHSPQKGAESRVLPPFLFQRFAVKPLTGCAGAELRIALNAQRNGGAAAWGGAKATFTNDGLRDCALRRAQFWRPCMNDVVSA